MTAFPTDILIAKTGGREALDRTAYRQSAAGEDRAETYCES